MDPIAEHFPNLSHEIVVGSKLVLIFSIDD